MIGVILAAGVGSRLRPLTNSKPKCLIKTAGKPILQYQIDAYVAAGIKKIIIVVGYEGAAIQDYCKHIKGVEIVIYFNPDYEVTNNMYSLYLVMSELKNNSFILNNADLSIDENIVKSLLEFEAEDAVAVDTSVFNDESMKVEIGADNFISNISKKIDEHASYACSIDFYKFSRKSSDLFFSEIQRIIEVEGNLKDWTEVAMQNMFNAGKLKFSACDIAGKNWVEIDNYDDLAISDRKFSGFDEYFKGVSTVLLDLDGTIYVGDSLIPGVVDVLSLMNDAGISIYFLSNNSSKNKIDYVERLSRMGLEVNAEQIVLSTDAVLDFLERGGVHRVHVLGTSSFKKIFLDSGFSIDDPNPEYVIVGYDTELNYQKIVAACKYINEGVDIIATHCDLYCPSEFGPIPDIGALIEMLRLTTGRSPSRVFGKPNIEMISPLLRGIGRNMDDLLMIGDRLHTDVKMAKNISCRSLLVLTGEATREDVEVSDIQPDYVLNSLGDVYAKC